MKFDAYLSPRRFWFIINEVMNTGLVDNLYPEKIRKTACFYGDKFNFYIDTSDGQAADFGQLEYCDRILRVVEDSKGKPFLFFKNWYSPSACKPIEEVARNNGGKVIPFMYWADWDHFVHWMWPNRKELSVQNSKTRKTVDIGLCCKPTERTIPKPSKFDPRISWRGYKWFNFGPAVDTGYYTHDTRLKIHKFLSESKFSYEQVQDVSFQEYILKSLRWKTSFDPPGVACVSHRMLECGWIGQCVILKKNDVDFAYSWKDYYPEVDIESPTLENDLGNIIENYEEWGNKIQFYLETFCSPQVITSYLVQKVLENYERN